MKANVRRILSCHSALEIICLGTKSLCAMERIARLKNKALSRRNLALLLASKPVAPLFREDPPNLDF